MPSCHRNKPTGNKVLAQHRTKRHMANEVSLSKRLPVFFVCVFRYFVLVCLDFFFYFRLSFCENAQMRREKMHHRADKIKETKYAVAMVWTGHIIAEDKCTAVQIFYLFRERTTIATTAKEVLLKI